MAKGRRPYSWIEGVRFLAERGETGLTGNIYCGLHEFSEMGFVLHLLNEGDLFIDVGANVGSYTLLSCGVKRAKGICFEPVPATFTRLVDNLRLNCLEDRVDARNMGVSSHRKDLVFTTDRGCMNHVVDEPVAGSVVVPSISLDEALKGTSPVLIKVDVEGFEASVIDGAAKSLASPTLMAVVMEISRPSLSSSKNLLTAMVAKGFETVTYDPLNRELQIRDWRKPQEGNWIFVRNIDSVSARLKAATAVTVFGRKI